MPIFEVRSPDGRVIDVNAPEGATEEQAIKYAQDNWESLSAAQPIQQAELKSRSLLNQYLINPINEVAGSVVEPALSMGTSMVAKPVSELAGMGAIGTHALGLTQADPESVKKATAEAMTYQPRTQLGASPYNPLNAIPNAIGSAVGGLTDSALSGMEESPLKAGTKEAIEQGVGFLGVKGAPKTKSMAEASNAAKLAKLQQAKSLERLEYGIKKKGQDIGLIAPAETGAKRMASGWGGVDSHLSYKNMRTATSKIAEELGIGKGAISDVDLNKKITELSSDYSNLKNALPAKINIDNKFKQEVTNILNPLKAEYLQDPQSFKGHVGSIDLLTQQLKQTDITPNILMEKIRVLRENARKVEANPSASIDDMKSARTSYDLANIYEDMMESNLSGKTAALEKFRDSRQKLAKIHLIDGARTSDGLIDLKKLGTIVGRYSDKKKYVSGDIKSIAEFANQYKQVSQPILKSDLSKMGKWEGVVAGASLPAAFINPSALVAATPAAGRLIFPWMADKGWLQETKSPSYELSGARKALPYAAQGMMEATALTPYVEEDQ